MLPEQPARANPALDTRRAPVGKNQVVTTTFPRCTLDSMQRCASTISSSGKVRSTTTLSAPDATWSCTKENQAVRLSKKRTGSYGRKRCERPTLIFQLEAGSKFQGRSSSILDWGWPAAIFSSVLLSQA